MPLTFGAALTIFEIYLLCRKNRIIYVLALCIVYGYFVFIQRAFFKYVDFMLDEIDLEKYSCIESNWY